MKKGIGYAFYWIVYIASLAAFGYLCTVVKDYQSANYTSQYSYIPSLMFVVAGMILCLEFKAAKGVSRWAKLVTRLIVVAVLAVEIFSFHIFRKYSFFNEIAFSADLQACSMTLGFIICRTLTEIKKKETV